MQNQNESLFLEALISSTSFAVVRLDTKHHIITCNEAFEQLFGYTCDEIIGEHLDDMISSGDYHNEASRISDSVSDGNLVRKISKRRRKDGSLVDVEIVGVPVTAAGENIGILGLYHDISLRKKTEEAFNEKVKPDSGLYSTDHPFHCGKKIFRKSRRSWIKLARKKR